MAILIATSRIQAYTSSVLPGCQRSSPREASSVITATADSIRRAWKAGIMIRRARSW